MTTGGSKVAHRLTSTRLAGTARWAEAYPLSDSRRRLQTALGVLWLFDGVLQLRPPLYSKASVDQLLVNAAEQPFSVHNSIVSAAHRPKATCRSTTRFLA